MRKISKMLWFAAMLGCCLGLPKGAFAAAHCFCSLRVRTTPTTSAPP